jgi:hypothetical protein
VSAPAGKLVVAHAERRAQRALRRLVGVTACPVEIVADGAALRRAVDADTIAVVDMAIAAGTPNLRDRPARAWVAVPGEGLAPAEARAVEALVAAGWSHVVAHPMPVLAEELVTTVQKLVRGEVFGVEKYLGWGAEIRTCTLGDARERHDAVAAIADDVLDAGMPERIASLVSVIADELLANALYVAPVDDQRRRFRAREARDRRRALRGRDVVTMRWATDARYLAIEVRDRWGTLDPNVVATVLAAGKARTAPDSGMGLPLAHACCNQLVIDLEPEVMTEVIALLDMRYRPMELSRAASFHAFVARAPDHS